MIFKTLLKVIIPPLFLAFRIQMKLSKMITRRQPLALTVVTADSNSIALMWLQECVSYERSRRLYAGSRGPIL